MAPALKDLSYSLVDKLDRLAYSYNAGLWIPQLGAGTGGTCHKEEKSRKVYMKKRTSFPALSEFCPLQSSIIEPCGIWAYISHFGLAFQLPFRSVWFTARAYCTSYTGGEENDKANPRTSSSGNWQEENCLTRERIIQVPMRITWGWVASW